MAWPVNSQATPLGSGGWILDDVESLERLPADGNGPGEIIHDVLDRLSPIDLVSVSRRPRQRHGRETIRVQKVKDIDYVIAQLWTSGINSI